MLLNNRINTLSLVNIMDHLFLIHCPPYQSNQARETLDLVLATAIFNDNTAVVFINDGVFQLLNGQQTTSEQKNIGKSIQAFELYGINALYVDENSLTNRGIKQESLLLQASTLSSTQLQDLIGQAKKVSNLL